MKPGLSGYTVARNCLSLDYCLKECVDSLLEVCDEVVICDSDSSDGTREMIDDWAKRDSRVRVQNYPWPEPVNDRTWLLKWMRFAQQHLQFDTQMYLDADEVLFPSSHKVLKRNISSPRGTSFWFERLNFWRDSKTIIPHGRCCSHRVARYGPTSLPICSDEIYGPGELDGPEPEIRLRAESHPSLRIGHFGFLRKREALFGKCKVVLKGLLGTWDTRLDVAMAHPEKPWEDFCPFDLPMRRYEGPHPPSMIAWLKERGKLA